MGHAEFTGHLGDRLNGQGIWGQAELTGPTADRKLGQSHPDQSNQWAAGVDKWRIETEDTSMHAEVGCTGFQKTQIFSEVRL